MMQYFEFVMFYLFVCFLVSPESIIEIHSAFFEQQKKIKAIYLYHNIKLTLVGTSGIC